MQVLCCSLNQSATSASSRVVKREAVGRSTTTTTANVFAHLLLQAKLTIKNEKQKLNDDGRERLVLLVAADKEAADKNDDLFFEKPGKVSDKKPNLNRLTECEDFPADSAVTYYADLEESGNVGKKVLQSLGDGIIGSATKDKNGGGLVLDRKWAIQKSSCTELN